jgi:hypothetical protein
MPDEKDNEKIYLDYLDKEMTIMGILSTFCIASLLVSVNSFILPGKDCKTNPYWDQSPWFCSLGLVGFLGAGLSFYKQRSQLAYYFGQISLNMVRKKMKEVKDLLDMSDSWSAWNSYKSGFGFLSISFCQFAFVLINSRIRTIQNWQPFIAWAIVCIFVFSFGIVIYACYKYRYADDPFRLLRDKSARAQYLKEYET